MFLPHHTRYSGWKAARVRYSREIHVIERESKIVNPAIEDKFYYSDTTIEELGHYSRVNHCFM